MTSTKLPQISKKNSPPDDLEYEYDETDYTSDQDQSDSLSYSVFQSSSSHPNGYKRVKPLDFPHMNGSNSLHL